MELHDTAARIMVVAPARIIDNLHPFKCSKPHNTRRECLESPLCLNLGCSKLNAALYITHGKFNIRSPEAETIPWVFVR